MKFDKRNPFAAWGMDQEVYTKSADAPVFESMLSSKNELFVDDATSMVKANVSATETFFTNNENSVPSDLYRRRMKMNADGTYTDNEYVVGDNYDNTELRYIHTPITVTAE